MNTHKTDLTTGIKLNPLVDFAFKKLFGVDENKDILIDLINAVVSEEDQIMDLEIKNPYNPKLFRNDKLSILDVKAHGLNNKWYIIEMQIIDQKYFDARALYYWSRVYHSQLANGINYDCLEKTISINFLNFDCLNEKNYHNVYKLVNQQSGNLYPNDHVELHFIELKKYHESFATMLDKWANFLVKAYQYDRRKLPKELQVPSIEKALDILENMALNNDEREDYEARLKWLRDEEMAIKKAKEDGIEIGEAKGRAEGKAEGKAEGLAEGKAEGKAEGLAEGKAEGLAEGKAEGQIEAKRNIARKLLETGLNVKLIADTTGLAIAEVEALRL